VSRISEYTGGNQPQGHTTTFSANDRDLAADHAFDEFMQYAASPSSSWSGNMIIVDKSGPWLQKLGNKLPAAVRRGEVRSIIHNRDDINALASHKDEVWGVDLANSLIKKLEARFIGEQDALIGAREAREKWGARLGDVPVVIKGFGLLGEQLARAMRRFGMTPANITVIDTDPQALERAKRLGFATRGPDDDATPRPGRAVVFIATPGVGVDAKNVHGFADEQVVIALTSGGKGVAMEALERAATASTVVRTHKPMPGKILEDIDLTLPRPGGGTTICRVITRGKPPNLTDDMWSDRYQASTCAGVSVAFIQAKSLTEPGVHRLDRRLDLPLVRLSCRLGLWRPRPLETRAGDDPEALRADLQSFSPEKL